MGLVTHVALKIYDSGVRAGSVKDKLPFSRIEGGVVILESALDKASPLNDHLVWLWGVVKHERRMLKSLVESGSRLVVECKVPKGPLSLLPNAAEFLHLVGAKLVLEPL
jgi:hypothetical protein